MKTNLKDIIVPLIKTLILLFILEVITTAVFPNIGLLHYRIPFNILLVLFLGLRLETPYLAIIIMIVQYFHGFFSVEGWEMGTVTGIVICIVVSYVREMIHFSSWGMTILITQVFQLLWFFVQSILIYIQLGSLNYIFEKGWRFLPQSVIIALLSPFFFYILNRIWDVDDRGMLGDKNLMFGEDDLVKSHQERADIIFNIIVIAFALLMARLWYLQIYRGKMFFNYSLENRLRKDVVRAPRGMIFSRNNVLLTHNVPRFDAIVTPQYLESSEETVLYLAEILEMTPESIQKILKRYQGQAKYIPIVIKKNISRKEVAIIETESARLPGVTVDTFISREYTDKDTGAHLLGYISEISSEKLPRYRERDKYDYKQGDFIGFAGIEQQFDLDIRGSDGYQFMEVDARGRARRHVGSDDLYSGIENKIAEPGKNIRLTIDRDVQLAAYNALAGKDGAAIALDVETGEIIAMVSTPAYDPGNFSTGLTSNYWGSLIMDEKRPLRDRTIQEHYSPGSTFKTLTHIAALEEGLINEHTKVVCGGGYRMGGRVFHCWKKEGHGVVDVVKALRESCDVFYYTIGNRIDIDVIYKYATMFGMGQRSGIILPRETQGLIPNKEWKKKRTGVEWQKGETLSCVIGQSFVNVTPLQLAMFYGTLANEGKLFRPAYVVKEVFSNTGQVLKRMEPEVIHEFKISKKTMDIVKEALYEVVNSPGGTALSQKGVGLQMSGKTGTAQVISFSADKIFNKCENQEYRFRHHGLFAGFAPTINPKIAFAVVIEHGCHGGSAAGPVAKAMVEAFMHKYYPTYQQKLIAQEKMTYVQVLEDNRVNPVPMVLESNPKDFFDENGKLVNNYVIDRTGKKVAIPIAPVPVAPAEGD